MSTERDPNGEYAREIQGMQESFNKKLRDCYRVNPCATRDVLAATFRKLENVYFTANGRKE